MSQPRFSWPPRSTLGSSDSLQTPVTSAPARLPPPATITRQYSSSCGDLTADHGAQGDGPHNQACPSLWEDALHTPGKNPSPAPDDHQYSEEESQRMNLFLKCLELNDVKINPKSIEKIMDAVKAGMFLISKRKESCIFDKVASATKHGVATSSGEIERCDLNAGVSPKNVLQGSKQQHRRFAGDMSKGRLNDKKTLAKTTDVLYVTNCSSHEKPECQNNSSTFAIEADISGEDLSYCDVEHYNDQELTYPTSEVRVSNKLIEHQKMMHSELDLCASAGRSQGSEKGKPTQKMMHSELDPCAAVHKSQGIWTGKLPQKIVGSKSTEAPNSSRSLTYRVELKSEHFNGNVIGRMIVAQAGETVARERESGGKVMIVAPAEVMRGTEDDEGNTTLCSPPSHLIGKVFTLRVVSLDIAQPDLQNTTNAPDIANVIDGIKRASDLGNAAGTIPPDCSLCLVKFTSAQHAELHLSGKAHRRRLVVSSSVADSSCEECNVIYTSPQHAEQHVVGRKHRSKVASLMEPPAGVPVKTSQDSPLTGEPLVCRVCRIATSSRNNLIDHFNGVKHLKKMEATNGKGNTEKDVSVNADCLIQPPRSMADAGHGTVEANEQRFHSQQSNHTRESIPYRVPRGKVNVSNLKMVRTVCTQSTNVDRDVTHEASDSCRGSVRCFDAPFCSCDPTADV